MAWTDPTLHIYTTGEVVTASTLNTYVQADMASLGNYAANTRYYSYNGSPGSATTATVILTQLGIATFPEAFTMIVKVNGEHANAGTAGGGLTLGITDEGGASITYGGTGTALYADLTLWRASNVIGKKQYAANGNAGFNLTYLVSAATVNISLVYAIEVTFVRGAV